MCLQRPELIVCVSPAVLTLTATDMHSQVLRISSFHDQRSGGLQKLHSSQKACIAARCSALTDFDNTSLPVGTSSQTESCQTRDCSQLPGNDWLQDGHLSLKGSSLQQAAHVASQGPEGCGALGPHEGLIRAPEPGRFFLDQLELAGSGACEYAGRACVCRRCHVGGRMSGCCTCSCTNQ